jgi:ankyrin repeat protein
VLVTHGASDSISRDLGLKTLLESIQPNPEKNVPVWHDLIDRFSIHVKQTATISIKKQDDTLFSHTIRPPGVFLTNPDAIIRYLNARRQEFIDAYNQAFAQSIGNKAPEITHQDAITWRNDNFLYMAFVGDKRLYERLTRNIGSFKSYINYQVAHDTALGLAAYHGLHELVNALLRSPDIDVTIQDNEGNTALMIAVIKGHKKTVEVLLQSGKISKDTLNITHKLGYPALELAAYLDQHEIVTTLLQSPNIDVSFQDRNGYTALMMAVIKGHKKTVEVLLSSGKITENDLKMTDSLGNTAKMLANQSGHQNLVKSLQFHLDNHTDIEKIKKLLKQLDDLYKDRLFDSRFINDIRTNFEWRLDNYMSVQDLVPQLQFCLTNDNTLSPVNKLIKQLENKKPIPKYLSLAKEQRTHAINDSSVWALKALYMKLEYQIEHYTYIKKIDELIETLNKILHNLSPENEEYDELENYIHEVSNEFASRLNDKEQTLQGLIAALTYCAENNALIQETIKSINSHWAQLDVFLKIYENKCDSPSYLNLNRFIKSAKDQLVSINQSYHLEQLQKLLIDLKTRVTLEKNSSDLSSVNNRGSRI